MNPYNVYIKDIFSQHMSGPIDVVFELGSNDGAYTEEIIEKYKPSRYFSVECNPKLISVCGRKVEEMRNKRGIEIHLIDKALSEKEGVLEYWTVDSDDAGELGSSSIYKHHYLSMSKMCLPCTTLDSVCKEHNVDKIDLICCDIEGGESKAFAKQEILRNTKYLIVEVGVERSWKPGYPVLSDFMEVISPYGFEMVEFLWAHGGKEWGDGMFVNKNL